MKKTDTILGRWTIRGHAVLEKATPFRVYQWMENRVARARAWDEKILRKHATVEECRAYWRDRGGCSLALARRAYTQVVPDDMKDEGGRPSTRSKPASKRGRPPKKKWPKPKN
jgi:hypothetical protein